ncbi:MAG TPA: hypothetical protein VLE94_01630 [Burkholderiaceae bacterium]|nr:hypothetical protein [Burkholderiaceae bacterium]
MTTYRISPSTDPVRWPPRRQGCTAELEGWKRCGPSVRPAAPLGWWMAPEASGTASKASAKELPMARGAQLYRRFSVDRSTDLANLDEAFEKIRERRTRLENQLITVLLIVVAAVGAAVVAAFR